MGSFEERVMKEFEALRLLQSKVEGIEAIQARLDGLDVKFEEQVSRLDQVQAKVNLSVSSIGEIHQEQVQVARVLKESTSVRNAQLDRIAAEGCLGASQQAGENFGAPATSRAQPPPQPPPPPLRPRPSAPPQVPSASPGLDEQSSK